MFGVSPLFGHTQICMYIYIYSVYIYISHDIPIISDDLPTYGGHISQGS